MRDTALEKSRQTRSTLRLSSTNFVILSKNLSKLVKQDL